MCAISLARMYSSVAQHGVVGRSRSCSLGFNTTVQPAASAGATLRAIIAIGKFQGVIAPTTPTGCFIVSICRSGAVGCNTSPVTLHVATSCA